MSTLQTPDPTEPPLNRRRFLALSTLAGITPGPFAGMLRAEPLSSPQPTRRSKLNLSILKQRLSTPQIGFPTLTPTFAAMFGPGTGPIQLVRSETFDDFTAQTQAQSNNGYVLSAMRSERIFVLNVLLIMPIPACTAQANNSGWSRSPASLNFHAKYSVNIFGCRLPEP
jgi:hypothetical protein